MKLTSLWRSLLKGRTLIYIYMFELLVRLMLEVNSKHQILIRALLYRLKFEVELVSKQNFYSPRQTSSRNLGSRLHKSQELAVKTISYAPYGFPHTKNEREKCLCEAFILYYTVLRTILTGHHSFHLISRL